MSFSEYKNTIPANGRKIINVDADTVLCYDADGFFKIEFDDRGKTVMAQGLKYQFELEPFKKISLINETAADIDVTLLIGTGDVDDSRLSLTGTLPVQNPAGEFLNVETKKTTSLKSHPVLTVVNNAAAAEILPINNDRVSVTITNNTVGRTVWLGDSDVSGTGRGFPLSPLASVSFGHESGGFTGAIYAHNASGQDVEISLLEVLE